ncbi:MAG: hypothetical protein ACT4QD_20700 [Acidobacteriota bacterium]
MRICLTLILVLLLAPTPARAWGFNAHRFIAERVIALLPAELRPLFERHQAVFVERSLDPDIWRQVGWETEAPNHFVDLDHFGAYPFAELPRDYDRAVEKFGRDVIHAQGLLPWRTQEFYGRLVRAFASLTRQPPSAYAQDDIVLFSAILAHYIGDGHVPLHAVVNYDGQRTNQHGLHARWEAELFDRLRQRLTIAPAAPTPVTDPREFMFDVLLASNRLADGVFAADKTAVAGREFYDDEYFKAFERTQFGVLEHQINRSMTAVASVIVGAWHAAGKPAVPLDRAQTPRPVRPRR